MDLVEFRITAEVGPDVDIDRLLRALSQEVARQGGRRIGYGVERLRVDGRKYRRDGFLISSEHRDVTP